MIIKNFVNISINTGNKKFYQNKGYDIKDYGNYEINIKDLSIHNETEIDVECDICKRILKTKYRLYLLNINKFNFYTCRKCSHVKTKKTCLEKYGVENPVQTNDIKEKIKNTCLIKYGVDNNLKIESIRNKINKNREIKYGNKNPFLTEYFKNKSLSTRNNNLIENLNKKNKLNIINKKGNNYEIYCETCTNSFIISSDSLYNRIKLNTKICTICNPINSYSNSGYEIQLQDFITKNYNGSIGFNKRNIIKPYEIDIYLSDLKLAFEFNGIYWHNELNVSNNYHLNKTEYCEKQGIHLINIYEDDWIYKQDIVKSRILNLIGKTPNKIHGRKCIIREINDNKLVRKFLEENHIQGFIGSQIKIGLYHKDELVSLMTFGKLRKPLNSSNENGVYEMLRFCNKLNTSVVGGADKLFKYFINTYHPKEVISYADRSWSQGNLYKKLGFELIHKTKPNYYYIINGVRKHRFNFRKDKLGREGYNTNLSEHDIMLNRKIYRIYDSGSLKFKK